MALKGSKLTRNKGWTSPLSDKSPHVMCGWSLKTEARSFTVAPVRAWATACMLLHVITHADAV